MLIGKVVGTVWSTRKKDELVGLKLLVINPINFMGDGSESKSLIAADCIGAGVGEVVLVAQGGAARKAVASPDIPIDAAVVGIVDSKEIDGLD